MLTFHGVNINGAPQLTAPVLTASFGSYQYKGGDYGDIVWPVEPQDATVIDQFLGISAATNTLTGQLLPAPGQVPLAVLNGTDAAHAARDTAASLRALGFPVARVGDTQSVGTESETRVYYGDTAYLEAAERVLAALHGVAVLALAPAPAMPSLGTAVTVVTGRNFNVVAPASPATLGPTASQTQATSAAPPATGTASAQDKFPQRPTASVEALAAWDTRFCNPAGGPGP